MDSLIKYFKAPLDRLHIIIVEPFNKITRDRGIINVTRDLGIINVTRDLGIINITRDISPSLCCYTIINVAKETYRVRRTRMNITGAVTPEARRTGDTGSI